ncbi:hypothetical protein EJP80_03265 [Rahnella aquatilis]|nr:hypothetical protein EJP80_03265 [Rahnella aquatilis]
MSNSMPSVLDKHITSVNEDSFGHRHFAQALQSLIESESNSAPYSIGLLGDWGTGKSSIKELYLNELNNDLNKDSNGFKRSEKIHTITYNAWRYGGKDQDVKRTLLRHVFLELGGDEEQLKDRLYNQINITQAKKKDLLTLTKEYLYSWFAPFPAFIVIILLLLGVLTVSSTIFPESGNGIAKGVFLSCITFVFGFILKQFKSPPVNLSSPVNKILLPNVSSEQYEEMLVSQVKSFLNGKVEGLQKIGKKCNRIVIFIDDLDRLSSEEMVTGLDAIRTFMEMPTSAVGSRNVGIIFVISCDERRVADALSRGRKNGDMPGTVFSSHDARRYLDRIFQFRLEIPPFPRQDMRSYALSLFKKQTGIVSEIENTGNKIESIVDRMIYPGVGTPRNALQIVNAFYHSWWIAKRRELEPNENRPGGLHDKAVTAHPISLGAICTLKVNFPEFYDQLLSDPTLIERFTDVLVRKKDIDEQPLTVKILLLEKYIIKSEQQAYEVYPHHRELRTFLSSLVGTRWPESLQSLLYLTEDPITRKFGGAVSRIYEHLVSGDTSSVLEQFGKHSGSAELSTTEATLIYQMTEDLNRESEIRRDNAFRVIAEIIDRVPSEYTSKISGQLCIALSDSLNLRSMVGINSITNVVRFSTLSNKTSIAARVVEDSLTEKGVLVLLENLGTPTLDDAERIAKSSVDLALEVLKEVSIGEKNERVLMDWIITRTIKIGEKSTQIDFSFFEGWVNQYQSIILDNIGKNYLVVLHDQITNSGASSFDISTSITNAKFVLDKMWELGATEQENVFTLLIDAQRLNAQNYISMIWEFAASHKDSFTNDAANKFLLSISENIINLNTQSKDDSFILKGFSLVLDFIVSCPGNISTVTFEKLDSLLISYSKDPVYTSIIISIMSEFDHHYNLSDDAVITSWYETDIEEIPIEYIEFATKRFTIVSQTVKNHIINFLSSVSASGEPSKSQVKRFGDILGSIDKENNIDPSLLSHIESFFNQVNSKYNNSIYCSAILPKIVPFIEKCDSDKIISFFQSFVSKGRGSMPVLSTLMLAMDGKWKLLKKVVDDYDFNNLFDIIYNCFISNQDNTIYPRSTLSGLKFFIDEGYVNDDYRQKLITISCKIWKTNAKDVISSLSKDFINLSEQQFANLAEGMDFSNEDFKNSLETAWGYKEYSQAYHIESLKHLLGETLKSLSDTDKFQILLYWFSYCQLDKVEYYKSIIDNSEFTYEHKALIFGVYHEMNLLDDLELLSVTIKECVKYDADNLFSDKVFGNKDLITNLLNNNEKRYKFTESMLSSFSSVVSLTYRKQAASWGKELIGNDALKFIQPEDINADDLEYLELIFKSASRIRTLRRHVEAE